MKEADARLNEARSKIYEVVLGLYADLIVPTIGALKGRLAEKYGEEQPDLSKIFLTFCREQRDVYVFVDGYEKSVQLVRPPADFKGFVDPCSPADPYPPRLWKDFSQYLESLLKIECGKDERPPYVFSRGRYGMAIELQKRNLPFLRPYKLGQLCHIIQLGINQKNLLSYEDNELKPVAACMARTHALMGLPQTATHADDAPHIKDVAELLACLCKLLPTPRDQIVLAMLKRKLRQVFGRRLSETALRCTKLSEVIDLPPVRLLFSLEKPNTTKTGWVIRRREIAEVHAALPTLLHNSAWQGTSDEAGIWGSPNSDEPAWSSALPIFNQGSDKAEAAMVW
jgi:hypothetical protein